MDDGTLRSSSSQNNRTVRGIKFKTGSDGYDSVFGKPAQTDQAIDHSAEADSVFLNPDSSGESWNEGRDLIGLSGLDALVESCATSSGLSNASTLPCDQAGRRFEWEMEMLLVAGPDDRAPLEVGVPSVRPALKEFGISRMANSDTSGPVEVTDSVMFGEYRD